MKKLLFAFFVTVILFLLLPNQILAKDEAVLYYGKGCSHCAKVEEYIKEKQFSVTIIKKEVYNNPQNANELNKLCEEKGISLMDRGVPFLYADDKCYIGDTDIISYLESNNVDGVQKKYDNNKKNTFGALPILAVIGAAFVDAINPCAFAVLLILMATILATGERKRALFAGLAFSLSIFISYMLMGVGLYSVIASIKISSVFMKVIGILAILIGLFNLKDYFWYGKWFIMEVPLGWRPKMKKLIKSVTSPFGAFLVGFAVSLFLLPCTSGPYIVIIGMLSQKATYLRALMLLVLYNTIFVLPMLAITFGTYFGMNLRKAEEERSKNLKLLHLIAGVIMLVMGIVLVSGLI